MPTTRTGHGVASRRPQYSIGDPIEVRLDGIYRIDAHWSAGRVTGVGANGGLQVAVAARAQYSARRDIRTGRVPNRRDRVRVQTEAGVAEYDALRAARAAADAERARNIAAYEAERETALANGWARLLGRLLGNGHHHGIAGLAVSGVCVSPQCTRTRTILERLIDREALRDYGRKS